MCVGDLNAKTIISILLSKMPGSSIAAMLKVDFLGRPLIYSEYCYMYTYKYSKGKKLVCWFKFVSSNKIY